MEKRRYFVLVFAVIVSGISQALLLSLLAIILERKGLPASANSMNAVAIYLGVLLASPFMEWPVKKVGYKWSLIISLAMMGLGAILFPVWENFLFWMGLRFLIGVGDSLLHFSTQTWILTTTGEADRGMRISFYGFSYGLGFGIGPLGINLYGIHPWFPFLFLFLSYAIVSVLVLPIKNEYPLPLRGINVEMPEGEQKREVLFRGKEAYRQYAKTLRLGWFTLLPAFLYGYLESTLNNNFPVYALRLGMTPEQISYLLSAFIIGGLLLQIPLGRMSDRFGRRRVLISIFLLGGIFLFILPWWTGTFVPLLLFFFLSGAFVGSSYSLGLAYSADVLPREKIAKANILASLLFGIGSIAGAGANGAILELLPSSLLFYLLGGFYFVGGLVILFHPPKRSFDFVEP